MRINTILRLATEFGTFRSRHNFFSFMLKCFFYIIPAVLLGNYTDVFIKILRDNKYLGDSVAYYVLLQTFFIIGTFFLIVSFLSEFMKEFQLTFAGGYFIVLYFGIQTNYIPMIKELLNNGIRLGFVY